MNKELKFFRNTTGEQVKVRLDDPKSETSTEYLWVSVYPDKDIQLPAYYGEILGFTPLEDLEVPVNPEPEKKAEVSEVETKKESVKEVLDLESLSKLSKKELDEYAKNLGISLDRRKSQVKIS